MPPLRNITEILRVERGFCRRRTRHALPRLMLAHHIGRLDLSSRLFLYRLSISFSRSFFVFFFLFSSSCFLCDHRGTSPRQKGQRKKNASQKYYNAPGVLVETNLLRSTRNTQRNFLIFYIFYENHLNNFDVVLVLVLRVEIFIYDG